MSLARILLMIVIAAIGYYFGREIGLDVVWTYFEALRTTSSIVFGVMSALLAIVYPEVVKQGFRTESSTSAMGQTNLHHIIDPLAQSALLLVLLLIAGPVFAVVSSKFAHDIHAQGIAFGVLCMLSAWQVWILIYVLRPLDLLRANTDIASAKAEIRRRIHHIPK